MSRQVVHDPLRAAAELREQLSSDKRRTAFFFGAGTSMAVGVPGIVALTAQVEADLPAESRELFAAVKAAIKGVPSVEDVLNRIRLCCELLDMGSKQELDGLGINSAKALDVEICQSIARIVRQDPPRGTRPHVTFVQWLHALHMTRTFPVEIFTTNYDVLLERAMEEVSLPFFDGFVGSVAPFFAPETVDAEVGKSITPPQSWTRLWKMHGSVGWHLRYDTLARGSKIVRLTDGASAAGEALMIFPSRDKYAASRRLPFLTYQDRLRRFLSDGESELFVLGYSFADEHLNEILFQGLQSNSRLAIVVLAYGDPTTVNGVPGLALAANLAAHGEAFRNLSIYGPDMAVIGGMAGSWSTPARKLKASDEWPFWAEQQPRFTLGDFAAFAQYLESFVGFPAAAASSASGSPLSESPAQEDTP